MKNIILAYNKINNLKIFSKRKYLVFMLLILILLTGCAHHGLFSPLESSYQCEEIIDINYTAPFGKEVHSYATYEIINMSNYSKRRKLLITYYSQYPDIEKSYAATYSSLSTIIKPWIIKQTCRNNSALHALHNGDYIKINKRRKNINSILQYTLRFDDLDWMSGILLHALADSYAHTKGEYGSKNEKAYNCITGHFYDNFVGKSPDNLKKNKYAKKKFNKYIDNLCDLFNIDKMSPNVIKLKNNMNYEFHYTPSKDRNTLDLIDKFTNCMNTLARPIERHEMNMIIKIINKGGKNVLDMKK